MGTISVQSFLYNFFQVVIGAAYLWLPAISAYFAWKFWVYYIRLYFISHLDWVLLEVKLPREIAKGPAAMEMIFNTMYQTRDGSTLKQYREGFLRAWFSLEIASINGQIHFYIYTQKGLKSLIEHQIYAQYPEVEITEAADYTKNVSAHNEGNLKFYAAEAALSKEDAYPIKTYVDYGLHNLQSEEEQRNDPMTSLLEFMGSLKEGEQAWFQIMIRAVKKNRFKEWQESSKKIVDEIMKKDEKKKKKKEGEKIDFGSMILSPGERTIVEAIERNVAKLGFDACVRMAYLAEKEKYKQAIPAFFEGMIKQYNSNNLNGFKLANRTLYVNYFFPETRHAWRQKRMFDAYVKRSSFYAPRTRKLYVLNTEELATIYHFPGSVAKTPTLERIESKKSEPPAGLPI